jgi:hypothetical protein
MDQDSVRTYTVNSMAEADQLGEVVQKGASTLPQSALNERGWTLDRADALKLMAKLREKGVRLEDYVKGRFYRGILTGLNEAFVINEETRKRLIKEDPKSKEIIKPWLRGRDIKKWRAEWVGLYIIAIASSANKKWPWSPGETRADPEKVFARTYPAIYAHLSQHKDALVRRDDQGEFWWELRSCAYYAEFERPKIVYPNITKTNIFSYDESRFLTNQKCFIIPSADKHLLGVLNSSIVMYWFKSTLPLLRGEFYEPSSIFMKDLSIFPATEKQKAPIIERVEDILRDPVGPHVLRLESEIDELIFDLYGLTEEERQMILASKQTSR